MIKVGQIRLTNPALLIGGACGTAALILISDKAPFYFIVAIGAVLLLAYLLSAFVSGNSQGLLPLWAMVYPLGYYFLSFPNTDHPIFTLDRALVAMLAAVLMLESLQHPQPLPSTIRHSGLLWAVFIGMALLSLRDVRGQNLVYGLHSLIEAFVMPGVLALYVLRRFDVRRYLRLLSFAVCVMSIYLAGIGMAEAVLHRDLLPLSPENTLALGNDLMFRANGPFGSGSTYGLVGVINFLLIRFLQRTIGPDLPHWQRVFQRIGMLAAFMVSLIPMHRGILLTWVVIGLIEAWQNWGNPAWWKRTAWKRVALLVGSYAALFAIKVILPYIYEDRIRDPGNIYGRLAEYNQSLAVLTDHLWLGAGFGQFTQLVSAESKYRFFFRGVGSIDSPHNTVVNIATDTGLLGFFFFALSQFFLLAAGRQLLLKRARADFTWWTFISIFAAYWVFGMDVSSGYLSELNMWYMFAIAICLKYEHSAPDCSVSRSVYTAPIRNRLIRTFASEGLR